MKITDIQTLGVNFGDGNHIFVNERDFNTHPLKTWRRSLVTEPDGNIGYQ